MHDCKYTPLPKKLLVHFFFATVPKLNLSHLAYTRPSVAA